MFLIISKFAKDAHPRPPPHPSLNSSFTYGGTSFSSFPAIPVGYMIPSVASSTNYGSNGSRGKHISKQDILFIALAAFCEDTGEEILPYLDPLMLKLITSVQSNPGNLQETCMSAIGSVAVATEKAFMPYSERVLELMKTFMVLTNDDDLRSRARATELVGIVALAVGRERMEPILAPYIEAVLSGFAQELQTKTKLRLVLADICSKLEMCRLMSLKSLIISADALKHEFAEGRISSCKCIRKTRCYL